MSPAMLSMLIRLMLAQAQECLFEKTALPGIRNQFISLMKMAQEAAKVNSSKGTTIFISSVLSIIYVKYVFFSCELNKIY